jgi:hypothetical protein
MESSNSRLAETFTRPAIAGVVALLVSKSYFSDTSATVRFLGLNIPASALIFGATAGSSFAGSLLANQIVPAITQDNMGVQTMAAALYQPGLTGAVLRGTMLLTGMSDIGPAFQFALIGAGSDLAGGYFADNFVKPALFN